jgi:hypothetical protein
MLSQAPSGAAANSALEAIEVLTRAGLRWDRPKLGTVRTFADIALLQVHTHSGNTSSLPVGIANVPRAQQELLRLSWWSLYACRPHEYRPLALLPSTLAPVGILHHLPTTLLGGTLTLAELAVALAPAEALRCARDRPAAGGGGEAHADDSYFFNETCRSLVANLSQLPPSPAWCRFHAEARGLYRLGDVVERGRHQIKGAGAHVMRAFNSSIAAEYLRTDHHGVNNIALLRSILDRRFKHEPPLEAVVHIRAGDTIDAPGTTHVQFLCDRNALGIHWFSTPQLGTYVKPLCYYESAADQLQRLGVHTVTIIAGNHNAAEPPRKSCAFIHVIGALLINLGFRVTYKLRLTADEGFAAAARARVFVPSGGGYSALIMRMVTANGGAVLRGGCPLFANDFARFPSGQPRDEDGLVRIRHSSRGWWMLGPTA